MKKTIFGVALIGTATALFLKHYPLFGKKPASMKQELFKASPNFAENKFQNILPTTMGGDLQSLGSIIKDYARKIPNLAPESLLPMKKFAFQEPSDIETSVTWFGHSSVFLVLDGKKIFIDPMLGISPSPFPIFGGKRYSQDLPFDVKKLPMIDIVLYSHDHYDHLDYGTVKLLKDKVGQFIVPLGLGSRLEGWGVSSEKIEEVDWWDSFLYKDIQFVSTPARHFSGRSVNDHNSTLWSSWVLQGLKSTIFYSGDSGYGPHFKEIGEKFGPFDLTMMECGQYDDRWEKIHMKPEETVLAHLDLQGKLMLPIHWGAFTLAFHEWTDPIMRVTAAAKEHNVDITTPRIGESIHLGRATFPNERWWTKV
jgi:L-ascorbate metabolism protein UlaG (beta-lactamase superfamily)